MLSQTLETKLVSNEMVRTLEFIFTFIFLNIVVHAILLQGMRYYDKVSIRSVSMLPVKFLTNKCSEVNFD